MLISLFAMAATIASGTATVEAITTGIGLGAGLYCASRSKKTSSMPRKAR